MACITSTFTSIENITKAIHHLPREIIETKVIYTELELWLENRMKELFNPIADIIASQESNRRKDPLKTINAGHISEKEEMLVLFKKT